MLTSRLDRVGVVALQRLLHLGERLAHLGLDVLGHLVLVLAQELLGAVDQAVGLVADLGLLAALPVLLGVLLGVPDHLLDVVLGQRRPAGDLHRLLLARAQVLGGHVHDAVGVDVEGDLDLRHAARRGRDAGQLEHAELLVVRGDLALTLEDLDLHRRLVVLGGGEDLRALGRDRGVPLDQLQDSDDPAPAKPPTGFNGVLTRAQWHGVIDFAHAVDAQLVTSFAISPGVRDASGVWTPGEADKVLNYTHSIGGSIAAAEMFNEPTFASTGGAPKDYDAAAYARDFRAFHAYIKKAAPEMTILGPGGVGESGVLAQMPGMKLLKSEDILQDEGPGLDAFSYHFYGGVSKRCAIGPAAAVAGTSPEKALSRDWLTRTDRDEAFYAALRDRFTPGKPIWLTETGETACGGDPWASSFIDSFRYLYQLGSLARKGVQVVMHNTLDASDYAFIDESTLQPRPNYWAAVLWRRLMGTKVLDAGESPTTDLYVFAHCMRGKPGGVTILAINADKANAHELTLATKSARYTLSSADLLSSTVQLNGAELTLTSAGDLPLLSGVPQPAGQVSLAPASIAFLAIPSAKNAACR